jgi:flagellar hook-associated protein 1 FlgK
MRDSTLANLQSTLDTLAAQLRDTVNAVHNRGVGFPGLTSLSGSRAFADTATQTITFGGDTDTALVLFDAAGKEVKRTTMRHLLDAASNGAGPYSIDKVAQDISTWLGAPGSAKIDSQGRLTIDVPTPGLTLALRDEGAVFTARQRAAGRSYSVRCRRKRPRREPGLRRVFGILRPQRLLWR